MKYACLLLAALLYAAPAMAQPQRCIAPQVFLDAAKARYVSAEIHVLKGEEAKAFLAAFNAIPPRTEFRADEIVIAAETRESAGMRILLFEKGCLKRAGMVPRRAAAPILLSIARAGA